MELYSLSVHDHPSLPWEETILLPIADVQIGTQGVALKRLRTHIEWGLANNAWFVGLGDYVDVMSPSNRVAWAALYKYDSVEQAMVDHAESSIAKFLHVVRGTEGRWIGVGEGHHFYDFGDGTTTDSRIADALGARHAGSLANVRLTFRQGHRVSHCWVCFTHGKGHGKFQGAVLNTLEDLAGFVEADIYIMGHQTKMPTAPKPRLYGTNTKDPQLVSRGKLLVGAGGWYEGYLQGRTERGVPRGGFVERGLMPPVSLGGPIIRIKPLRNDKLGSRLQLTNTVST